MYAPIRRLADHVRRYRAAHPARQARHRLFGASSGRCRAFARGSGRRRDRGHGRRRVGTGDRARCRRRWCRRDRARGDASRAGQCARAQCDASADRVEPGVAVGDSAGGAGRGPAHHRRAVGDGRHGRPLRLYRPGAARRDRPAGATHQLAGRGGAADRDLLLRSTYAKCFLRSTCPHSLPITSSIRSGRSKVLATLPPTFPVPGSWSSRVSRMGSGRPAATITSISCRRWSRAHVRARVSTGC